MNNDGTIAGLLGIHALTALHPGAGTALGTVDLPVQRERHTGWPNIAGSALKGILRDTCREKFRKGGSRGDADKSSEITELFGPPTADSSDFAGALSVTDARLLAYPVRSLKGVFAWITCPAVMERFARDVMLAKMSGIPSCSTLKPREALSAMTAPGCPCLISGKDPKSESSVLFEEFKLNVVPGDPSAWAKWVAKNLLPSKDDYQDTIARFQRQLVVVHDDDFTHFVKYATEVTARIGLNYDTKTVKDGALFYQEFLPTETLFYTVTLVNAARSGSKNEAAALAKTLGEVIDETPVLQIGGDETTGKGYCAIRWTMGGGK